MDPQRPTKLVSVSVRRLEDTVLKRISNQPNATLPLPSTPVSMDTTGVHDANVKAVNDGELKRLKETIYDMDRISDEAEEPPRKRKRTMPTRYGITPERKVKSPLKQVAYPRKSPTKANYSNDASLKTIKKYRNNAKRTAPGNSSPDKKLPSSPLKRRVVPKRRIKSEVEKLLDRPQGIPHETELMKALVPVNSNETNEEKQEFQVREWLACNEGEDVRPVRAAAIAAAKKGQLGVIKPKPNQTKKPKNPVLRVRPTMNRKDRVPKGRSRRTIMKKASCPRPIRGVPNDGDIEFHKSLVCWETNTYFQIGDIVAIKDSSNRTFYLQVEHLIIDEYSRECAGMKWLVPITPNMLSIPIEPKNFRRKSNEKSVLRYLTDIELIAHCPWEYFDDINFLEDIEKKEPNPVKGTVYIRITQSKEIMTFEKPDIPEIQQHNQMVEDTLKANSLALVPVNQVGQSQGTQSDEALFKRPDTSLIPWIDTSFGSDGRSAASEEFALNPYGLNDGEPSGLQLQWLGDNDATLPLALTCTASVVDLLKNEFANVTDIQSNPITPANLESSNSVTPEPALKNVSSKSKARPKRKKKPSKKKK